MRLEAARVREAAGSPAGAARPRRAPWTRGEGGRLRASQLAEWVTRSDDQGFAARKYPEVPSTPNSARISQSAILTRTGFLKIDLLTATDF